MKEKAKKLADKLIHTNYLSPVQLMSWFFLSSKYLQKFIDFFPKLKVLCLEMH